MLRIQRKIKNCGFPKFSKNGKIWKPQTFLQKPIDKSISMCYNKGTKEREVNKMTVKELKEMIKNLDDNDELVFIEHRYCHGYYDEDVEIKIVRVEKKKEEDE